MGTLAKPSSGSGSGTGNGTPSPAEAHLMRFLRAAESDYDQDLSAERIEQWLALLKMKQRFSLQEITEAFAVVQISRPGGWTGFPKRPDVIAQIVETRAQEAERTRQKGGVVLEDPNCLTCGGIGWVAKQTDRGNQAVSRCHCWKQGLEAWRIKHPPK